MSDLDDDLSRSSSVYENVISGITVYHSAVVSPPLPGGASTIGEKISFANGEDETNLLIASLPNREC